MADAQTRLAKEAGENERKQKALADQKAGEAIQNQSVALTALADIEADMHPVNAAKLALAAWPRGGEARIAPRKLSETWTPSAGSFQTCGSGAFSKGMMGSVGSAAFSPDGKRVVTASKDKTARVWDPETGTQIALLKGHDGTVRFRRLQPGRQARRHRLCGQDRARLGPRDRNPDRSAQRT